MVQVVVGVERSCVDGILTRGDERKVVGGARAGDECWVELVTPREGNQGSKQGRGYMAVCVAPPALLTGVYFFCLIFVPLG